MFSFFAKDPKDLFKKCEQCNSPTVCEANLKVIKNESKVQDWPLSIGSEAAAQLFITLQSLKKTEQIRFKSNDTAVALDLLSSLANELDWCTGNCEGTGSKLKIDIIDDSRDEIENSATFEKCVTCKRTLVSKKNLWIIRGGVTLGFVTTLGGFGVLMLPLLGFGAGGVVAGSTAAAWQSSIGSVAAGRLFATLQSLGATGLGVLLFGSTGSALGLLGSLAVKLDWCTGECSPEKGNNLIEIVNSNQSKFIKLRLTITKIADLVCLQSPDFELGNAKCKIKVLKQSNCLGISINSNGPCKMRGMIELLGINDRARSIRKLFTKDVTIEDGITMDELVSWDNLFARNTFIHYNSITIEIKIRIKDEAMKPLLLDCLICLEDIESQEISSVPCGHIFCTKCIEKCLKLKTICPVCKTTAEIKDLRRIILPM